MSEISGDDGGYNSDHGLQADSMPSSGQADNLADEKQHNTPGGLEQSRADGAAPLAPTKEVRRIQKTAAQARYRAKLKNKIGELEASAATLGQELEVIKTENSAMKDANKALEIVNEEAARLSAVAALAAAHCGTLPSSRISDPLMRLVQDLLEALWTTGDLPHDDLLQNIFSTMPASMVVSLEKNYLVQLRATWNRYLNCSPQDRPLLLKIIENATYGRRRACSIVASARPEDYIHQYKSNTPDLATPEGRLAYNQMRSVIESFKLTPEQLERIKNEWIIYKITNSEIDAETEALNEKLSDTLISEVSNEESQVEEPGLQARAEQFLTATQHLEALNSCTVKRVSALTRLNTKLCEEWTLEQTTQLHVATCPFTPSCEHYCMETLGIE